MQTHSSLSKYVLYITILSSMFVLGYLYWDVQGLEDELMQEQISDYESLIQTRFDNFFEPIEEKIKYHNSIIQIEEDSLFDQKLIDQSILFLKNSPQVSSMLIANTFGEELMTIDLNGKYQVRKTSLREGSLHSTFYEASSKNGINFTLEKLTDLKKENYNPKSRPWFINGLNTTNNQLKWTKPYQFFTTKDLGITASSLVPSQDSLIVAYDIKLNDLSNFTSNIKIEENGRVFILSSDSLLIALPYSESMIDSTLLLSSPLALSEKVYGEFINEWEKTKSNNSNFSSEGSKWKYSISQFALGNQTFYAIKVLKRGDFSNSLKRFRYTLIGSFILLGIFMYSIIRGYRRKRKTNILLNLKNQQIEEFSKSLFEQKQIVEETLKETLDSIQYAKRIQFACLPNQKNFESLFPNGFLWFLPKDIVSGDFYWFGENSDQKWLIAADCTGHGVPGALLSILGSVFINELVNNYNVREPSELLSKLKELIIKSLRESENDAPRDGMDMAVLCFNKEKSKVKYAGAKNPLYLLRNGEVTVYKADRMPVGFEDDDKSQSFKQTEIELEPNDELYIFSDGLADQFGGEKGKKLMYKRIRDLLVEFQTLSMAETKTRLEKVFNEWKREHDQVDDILFIGVKV